MVYAILTDNGFDLREAAESVNRGRTDDVSFYVNGDTVLIDCLYGKLDDQWAKKELEWFLGNRKYKIIIK